jgi:hypothetical protein
LLVCLRWEGRSADKELEEENSESPEINCCCVWPALNYFWSHVFWSATPTILFVNK